MVTACGFGMYFKIKSKDLLTSLYFHTSLSFKFKLACFIVIIKIQKWIEHSMTVSYYWQIVYEQNDLITLSSHRYLFLNVNLVITFPTDLNTWGFYCF